MISANNSEAVIFDNQHNEAVSRFIGASRFPALICAPGIVLAGGDYQPEYYREDLFAQSGIPFPYFLSRAVNKRQSEYLAGRLMASRALAKLGVNTRNIATGEHRSPVWPDGIVASITHTATSAFCAAARSRDIKFLGIDHENWLGSETVADIKSSIINHREEALLQQSALAFSRAFTLVFSAKESLFKALYPSVGYYFDFSAAEIIALDNEEKSFVLQLTESLTPTLSAGATFTGKFIFDDLAVQTLICEPV
ncbi:4'-phosphopantetheinyl transferase superfamily protein [Thalassomonas viridans]|uniref:Enterobactin synthase component D n=1 Tax=Thalassomonas viridans TaxID=137584 RepID=A0AAE9YY29_9GAMM|nr:4'-phosphopantetheinyl transferase superfamily protein [Thalassomonas viridans]WDE03341.1 4'-phosphopantetheinyl transferase superfamily protein [Thalassomonas viridans]